MTLAVLTPLWDFEKHGNKTIMIYALYCFLSIIVAVEPVGTLGRLLLPYGFVADQHQHHDAWPKV